MDADLRHPPVLLKEMYKAVSEEGYDCCAGKRVDRTGEGKIRNFLSHTFYKSNAENVQNGYERWLW